MNWLVDHSDALGLLMIIDYGGDAAKYGRAWRCDREAWKDLQSGAVTGAGNGDWLHLELDDGAADDSAILSRLELVTPGQRPAGSPLVLRRGSTGPWVHYLQEVLVTFAGHRLVIDGCFGRQTEASVVLLQRCSGVYSDGIVGPITWTVVERLKHTPSSSRHQ